MKLKEPTKTQFKEDFKRGLGSSYIQLKDSNNREKYRDIVLWCCIHNTCYDMQCEGGRGSFLYNAISLFEDKSFFEEAIIQRFMRKNIETWLFDQLCELLYLFSLDGSTKAREALHTKYNRLLELVFHKRDRDQEENLEWLSTWLTSLDGFTGFKNMAQQFGEYAFKNTDGWSMDWFYSNAKNKFGAKRVDMYLQKNATKSPYIQAFLESVSDQRIQHRSDDPPLTLARLVEAARKRQSRGLAIRFGKVATNNDLIELAKYAIAEANPLIKLELLWAFRKVRFPLDEQWVFELTESDHPELRDIAFDMLVHLPSDRTHDYAIRLMLEKKELGNALSLLCSCYRNEDEELLFQGIKGLDISYEEGDWHSVFMSIEHLLDNRSFKISPALCIYIYRQTLCSVCRNRLIQKMSKRNMLPPAILEECLYDSYEDLRRWARRKQKKLSNSK